MLYFLPMGSNDQIPVSTILRMSAVPFYLAIAVFANTLGNELAYDDPWTLHSVESFELSLRNLFQMRGLTYTVHKLDVMVWNHWVVGLHITNVLLHALASALAAAAAFAVSRSLRVGLLCGLVFAVHPVHSEVVASISYRKDTLAMIFVAIALIIWTSTRRPWLRYVGTVLSYVMAVLAKEVAAVALPVMLFLVDLLPARGDASEADGVGQRLRLAFYRFVPILLLGLAFVILSLSGLTSSFFQASRAWVPEYAVTDDSPSSLAGGLSIHFTPEFIREETEEQCQDYGEVLATVAASIPDQARLLAFPLELGADHPTPPERSFTAPRAIAGVLILLVAIVAAVLMARRAPVASFAIAWTIIMFIPVSNLVPLIHFFVVERFLYVPSFGACLLLAVAIDSALAAAEGRGRRLKTAVVALVVVLVAAGGVRSAVRNTDWHDNYTIWSAAIRDGCGTFRAYNSLGQALARRGRHEEAIAQYEEALRIQPGFAAAAENLTRAHNNAGVALLREGNLDGAIAHYTEALHRDLEYESALANLVSALRTLRARNGDGAAGAGNARAYNVVGRALAKRGQYDEALEYFQEAVRVAPEFAEGQNDLGVALARRGEIDEAITHYRTALRIDPGYARAHGNLGTVLARRGAFEEAIEHFSQAVRLEPTNARAHLNLGVVLETTGRREEAAEHYSEALRLDPDQPRADYYREKIRELRRPK